MDSFFLICRACVHGVGKLSFIGENVRFLYGKVTETIVYSNVHAYRRNGVSNGGSPCLLDVCVFQSTDICPAPSTKWLVIASGNMFAYHA